MLRVFDKTKIPKPDIKVIFPDNYKNFDVEIGCGVGFHPIDYASKNPERLLVAIEKTTEKFEKFQRRVENHKHIKNLIPIHTNAVWWITHELKENSVDRYFILYPNPYPKDPQKRFFQMPFTTWLVQTLKPGGTIELATNEKFYIDEVLKNATEIFNLKILENRVVDFTEKPRSHFEKKYLERKEVCYNIILQKYPNQ